MKGWERLPREEILTRACQAIAAVAHQKSRNAELVYRLQQTHEEAIEAKQIKGRFAELQASQTVQRCPLPNEALTSELAVVFAGIMLQIL